MDGGANVTAKRASSSRSAEVTSVGMLLDRIEKAAEAHEPVSLRDVMEELGGRSFGPLLLLAGLIMLSPGVGDIPGVPVMMGLVTILTTGQLLLHRPHIWLPGWLLRRSVSDSKVHKGVRWMRPVGRVFDRWSRRRMTGVLHGAGLVVTGIASIVIAAATPLMEVVPFSANVAGIAITAYGLALIASDGLLALVAVGFSIATVTIIVARLV